MSYRHGALDRTTSARVHGRLRPGTDLDPVAAMACSPVAHTNDGRDRGERAQASGYGWLLNEPARHRLLLADLYRQMPELAANAQAAPRVLPHRSKARHSGLAAMARTGTVHGTRRLRPSPFNETRPQSWLPFACPGVMVRSKVTSTGSKCSSARCMVVPDSTCCACASSTPTKPHRTGVRSDWIGLHQMCA